MRGWLEHLLSGLAWVAVLGWIAFEVFTGYRPSEPAFLGFVALVVVGGELLEVDLRGGRSTPVSIAVIFALFVVLDPLEVLMAVLPALILGMAFKGRRIGWEAIYRSTSRRLISTLAALATYLGLVGLLPDFGFFDLEPGVLTSIIAVLFGGAVKLLVDTGISAGFIAATQRIPAWPIWQGQLQNRMPLQVTFVSVAALMALSYGVLGAWAFGLFLLPLIAARPSFRRYASINKTYSQTIRGLSMVPELAKFSPEGHSARVAEISTAMARDFGFSDNEVQNVEFAALLHDVGRIKLGDPDEIPESVAGTLDAKVLARASASILQETHYLNEVTKMVRRHGDSYLDTSDYSPDVTMLGSRMIRVANDFVELTEDRIGLPMELALEQLENRSGADYDPTIVVCLQRVLRNRTDLASV
jgi:hypothetical protein